MPTSSDVCLDVSPECPVEASIYGYYPNLGANAFFVAFFATCFFLNLGLGFRYKTWTYMVALSLGCLTETIGYIGRLIMRSNPFADSGFITQICCLIIAPAFNSAAIYLTLKHVTLCFGPEFSLLKPRFYTYIFIFADLVSLVLQAIGGALASTADTQDQQDLGDNLMMAGISWQVVSLFFFALSVAFYISRRWRALARHPLSAEASATLRDTKFRLFALGVFTAWITIFIRCVYRIIEMAGGWRNSIMRNETDFIVLEGVMLVLATFMQTFFHPGYCFPRLSSRWSPNDGVALPSKSSRDVSMENFATSREGA
ncbi:Efflux pump himE [Exophiala dermatitidis]